MNNFFDFITFFGIPVDESTPLAILISAYYLILSVGVLLNVLNISIYMLSIYIVSHEKFLSQIPVKYVYIHKFLVYYKNIRIGFIIFELILLLVFLFLMIGISYGLVSFYLVNK